MANAKQQKLRQLMKEKKASSENTRINSPIARYFVHEKSKQTIKF